MGDVPFIVSWEIIIVMINEIIIWHIYIIIQVVLKITILNSITRSFNLKVSVGARAGRQYGEYSLVIFKIIVKSEENENDAWELRCVNRNVKGKIYYLRVFAMHQNEKPFG